METLGFNPSKADPCLFIKENKGKHNTFIIIYVDDGGIFGTKEEI